MLSGVLTGRMPTAPAVAVDDVWKGRSTYHAVLTPKGKMITDLWATLLGPEESTGFLLDVPVAGAPGLSNDRSFTYCARTLSDGWMPLPGFGAAGRTNLVSFRRP